MTNDNLEFCPSCKVNLQGAPVPESKHLDDCPVEAGHLDRCFCLPYGDATHFSRKLGIEVRGVYDGILYWMCPDCGHAWARFGGHDDLAMTSEKYARMANDRVTQ